MQRVNPLLFRWVKYEEAVEEGGERWSKPHVSSLPMEALMELQSLLAHCPVLLDLEAYKMSGVAGKMVEATRIFSTYCSPDGTSVPVGILPSTA